MGIGCSQYNNNSPQPTMTTTMAAQEQEELYEPVEFAYSQTIGASQSSSSHSEGQPYPLKWTDILLPRLIDHFNPIFYLLFHTPPLYNWIRSTHTQEASLLNHYISSVLPSTSAPAQIDLSLLKDSLQSYVRKWQVAKLTFSCAAYVKSMQIMNGPVCTHLMKREHHSWRMRYQPAARSLSCDEVFCVACNEVKKVATQIRNYPPCCLLPTSSTQPLAIVTKQHTIRYQPLILMAKTAVYIKAANQVWYHVDLASRRTRVCSLGQIRPQDVSLALYSQPTQQRPAITIATAFLSSPPVQKASQTKEKPIEETQRFPIVQSKSRKSQEMVAQNGRKLRGLKPRLNEVIVREQKGGQGYTQQVRELIPRAKVKDDYELKYDAGRLNKRKERKAYAQPDYDQVYQQLQKKQLQPQGRPPTVKSKKIHKREKQRQGHSGR